VVAQVDWIYYEQVRIESESRLSAVDVRELTQARRVKLCKPSCWVISAGLMAFYQKEEKISSAPGPKSGN
jgi:hypothetical protein